jgi:membrane-associated phospholipid phosphatase
MGKTNPFYIAALGAGYAFNVRTLRTIPTEILESHLLAGGIRNVGKLLVGRKHPYEHEGPYQFDFGKGTSFPSGHTSVVFELATIASMNARSLPVTIGAYALATTVALQRIDSLNHWPSDVFVAATYGTLVARTVVQLHEQRESGRDHGTTLVPHISDDGRLLGVKLSRTF